VVRSLRGTSRTLKTATSKLLSGATDLSGHTAKQSATIEETSAAMNATKETIRYMAMPGPTY
jgi:methyl-accepting chemotaxis protein